MTAFELLRERLLEQRKIFRDAMADGSAPDYSAYQNYVGTLHGINIALRELTDIERIIEKSEE